MQYNTEQINKDTNEINSAWSFFFKSVTEILNCWQKMYSLNAIHTDKKYKSLWIKASAKCIKSKLSDLSVYNHYVICMLQICLCQFNMYNQCHNQGFKKLSAKHYNCHDECRITHTVLPDLDGVQRVTRRAVNRNFPHNEHHHFSSLIIRKISSKET